MIRTQEEILERFENSNDPFNFERNDLIPYLEFENAKELLNDEFVAKVESGEEKWNTLTDEQLKETIINYLPFAYNKAENQRGLSAARSMQHFKTWIWLEDKEFYNQIVSDIDTYSNYGLPTLDKIAEHYSYVKS